MLLEGKGGSGGGRVVGSGGEGGVGGKREGWGGVSQGRSCRQYPPPSRSSASPTITCSTRTDASASWRAHATLEQEPKRSETAAVQHQAPEDDLNQSTKKNTQNKKTQTKLCVRFKQTSGRAH